MLLIPITGKMSWRNPPIITLGLILINVLVFFILQGDDDGLQEKAISYYFESGLADIEIPLYMNLRRHGEPTQEIRPETMAMEDKFHLYFELSMDSEFQEKLRAGELISTQNPNYEKWRETHQKYEAILSRIVGRNYGFRPAYPSAASAFAYMFLHGNFGHLFGNMLFLWILCCLLEMGFGRLFVGAVYIITGFTAVFLFWLVYMDSAVPLVGASGAIAGLMGAFAVMFGRSRVKVFYTLGFYFNYVRFPAIALFPIWIGNELIQLFFTGESQVAYVAHIGGLIGGGLIGGGTRYFLGARSQVDLDDEKPDEIAPIIEKALQRVGLLDMEGGRRLLESALEKDPNHCEALGHLFNIDKINPESKEFHQVTKRLLQVLCEDRQQHGKAWEKYQEYRRLAKPPKLPPELYLRLGSVFCGLGRVETAEQILSNLLKRKPDLNGLPAGLIHLANAFKASGEIQKQRFYLQLLRKTYPQAAEATIANNLLKIKVV